MRTTLRNKLFLVLIFSMFSTFTMVLNAQTSKTEPKKTESNVIHLTKEEFQKKVFDFQNNKNWKYLGDKPCVLDFFANWCGPCRMISPYLDELSMEYKDQIYIYKINVDQEKELASIFGASSIPLLIFIPTNAQPQATRGALPKEELKKAIETVLLKK